MKYERQKLAKAANRAAVIEAALNLWEAHGEKAVSVRRIGAELGVSGQAVHKVIKRMGDLKQIAIKEALRTNRTAIILQLQASGHVIAPKLSGDKLL